MSLGSEISRLYEVRNAIRAKLYDMGLAAMTDNFDTIADIIVDMVSHGAVNITIREGESYNIPVGFHNGGKVTATGGGGNYTTQSKTATPIKSKQTITADSGYYALSSVVIEAIPAKYHDVSGVTAGAADVVTGQIIVLSNGTVIEGTMPDNGAVSETLEAGESYTIPAGKHSGAGKVTAAPIPSTHKDVTGVTAGAADVVAGKKIITLNGEVVGTMPDNGAVSKTLEAGESYTIPAGKHSGAGKVTAAPIPSTHKDVSGVTATAADVVAGKKIVTADGEVNGTMPDNGAVTKNLTKSTTSYTIPAGKHSGAGKVSVSLETKTVTPTEATQTINPSTGKLISQMTINPIPAKYKNTANVTAGAADVLTGKKIVTADGEVTGTMPDNGAVSIELEAGESYTIPAGKHSGAGKVTAKGGGSAILEMCIGTIHMSGMGSAYHHDKYGKATDTFIDGMGGIEAPKGSYVVVENMNETNPAPMLVNCSLTQLLGYPMGANYAYLISIDGDNFSIEG